MKYKLIDFIALFVFIFLNTTVLFSQESQSPLIIDHNCANLSQIPDEWIDSAKINLHIAYGHTSHGSQLITGMDGLVTWKGDKYAWHNGNSDGALDIRDKGISGANDLGNPNRTEWATATRNYLNNPENNEINVIIWSWCGQAGTATETNINTYLNLMTELENDFPDVRFVYMTGHLNGSGEDGNLHKRNEQIRAYCRSNGKILYDFADIESFDPDGNYYLNKYATDNCDYDSDGNKSQDKNWAENWQNSHTEGVDWYNCSAAHSKPLNGNLKAYTAWWLWASLAGWDLTTGIHDFQNQNPDKSRLYQNYPNPFNTITRISYSISHSDYISLKIYNQLGNEVETLLNEFQNAGTYSVVFDASNLSSGIYFYKLQTGNVNVATKRMILSR